MGRGDLEPFKPTSLVQTLHAFRSLQAASQPCNLFLQHPLAHTPF